MTRNDLPHFANLRDGELLDDPQPRPWLGLVLIGTGFFWATIIAIVIAG